MLICNTGPLDAHIVAMRISVSSFTKQQKVAESIAALKDHDEYNTLAKRLKV